jgi:hypothetical protein
MFTAETQRPQRVRVLAQISGEGKSVGNVLSRFAGDHYSA